MQDWNDPQVVSIPYWINIIIILALTMAVICNICVLFRFLERWIWHSVILSLITATMQDILCVAALVPFCILYPPSKGYVYLEGFWTMIASMVFSFTATLLMSIDLHRTPNFHLLGSGVTHKQRILIAEAMFFVMVTITTIGFGDIVPQSTGGRVFVIFYAAGGIVLLAMAVNAIRYVIIEDLHQQFATRAKERKARRDAKREERRIQRQHDEEKDKRIQETMERIKRMEVVPKDATHLSHYVTYHPPRHFLDGEYLRIPPMLTHGIDGSKSTSSPEEAESSQITKSEAITASNADSSRELLEDDKEEEGISPMLDTAEFSEDQGLELGNRRGGTHMNSELMLCGASRTHSLQAAKWSIRRLLERVFPLLRPRDSLHTLATTVADQQEVDKQQAYRESIHEYQRRLRFSAIMFLTFWLVGATIFAFIESWDFGSSVFFVFVAFSTIGYGDFVPMTMAGRAIFLAYCLVGVVALTFLASLISEVLSKSMRRHVVKAQLRRTERLKALGEEHVRQENRGDLEAGAPVQLSSFNGLRHKQSRFRDHFAQESLQEPESTQTEESSEGSLQKLIILSKNFDQLLHYVLEHDCQGAGFHTSVPKTHKAMCSHADAGAILEYLEKEDTDLEPSCLNPSISRDITSTDTIQRKTKLPWNLRRRRHSIDRHSVTFHGSKDLSTKSDSQFNIAAWSASDPKESDSSHSFDSSPATPGTENPSSWSSQQHSQGDTVTVSAIHWHQLIDYSKQLRALTEACNETLQKVASWEAAEKKSQRRRQQFQLRQKRLLELRRKRLQEYEEKLGKVEDNLEDKEELEELEEWEEEGSEEEEEDARLDRTRTMIATELMGGRPLVRGTAGAS
ncbi:hypothetical protein BG011_006757 [Mortierella polycephala]|uniref:Potassium channel domain-containing protein n=1 Tax=Mortierella polycephala TaxID=41804 RepID=A0A9P6QIF7_9FUNG|nr:hypothetical protein BG011_006757 [Mortierella polycephala]